MCTDIQYKEGILEYLEINNKIDYIILNKDLDGKIKTEELIKEIKNIENRIKIILTSDEKLSVEKIINEINNNLNNKKEIKKEINKKIKNKINNKIMSQKNININSEKIKKNKIEKNNYNKYIFNQKTIPINNLNYSYEKYQINKKEIICILGPNGIGKSVFSILFAQNLKDKKSIIIDFDTLNNSMQTLLGIKKYEEKINKKINQNNLINHNQKINKFVIKTNLKIDLLSGLNLILDPNYKLSYKKIKEIINELKQEYDVIIFDTAPYNFLDYTKEIINLSDKAIFISGANLLEIKKSEKLLNIYEGDWNINRSKINIIFNKYTNKSIDDETLKEIFSNYNILGKINLSDYYDAIINKNMPQKSKLHKQIEEIKKQIIKEKYSGII